MTQRQAGTAARVLVWDLPVRAFHALLIVAFAAAWLTSGDDRYTYAHAFAGYCAALLAAFRVAWGFSGTRHARFRAFAVSPRRALAYVRDLLHGHAARYVGHNPVGSWAVWLLLSLPVLLAISGLLTLGGEEQQGPLAGWTDRAGGMRVGEWHRGLAWAGVALIAVHIAGVIVEGRVHRENLVRAMIDGRKPGTPADAIVSSRAAIAVLLVLSLALFAAFYFRGYLQATTTRPYLPYTGTPLPAHPLWEEECGACHLAYHPSLLPAQGWRAMFAQQQDHFGEPLGLDGATVDTLLGFATANSAEQGASEAAVRIAATTEALPESLRITGLAYWRMQHADIDDAVWKTAPVHGKSDCGACHYDAGSGTFEDSAMRIP